MLRVSRLNAPSSEDAGHGQGGAGPLGDREAQGEGAGRTSSGTDEVAWNQNRTITEQILLGFSFRFLFFKSSNIMYVHVVLLFMNHAARKYNYPEFPGRTKGRSGRYAERIHHMPSQAGVCSHFLIAKSLKTVCNR
jgi:hypothetical protein